MILFEKREERQGLIAGGQVVLLLSKCFEGVEEILICGQIERGQRIFFQLFLP